MRVFLATLCLIAACGGGDGDGGPGPMPLPDAGKGDAAPPPTADAGEGDDATLSPDARDVSWDGAPDVGRDEASGRDDAIVADVTGDGRTPDVTFDATSDLALEGGNSDDGGAEGGNSDAIGDTGGPTAGLWLKGDLHVHSNHSTDALDTTVAEAIAKAESLGFDYFVLTDHDNHVEGKVSTWSDPDYHSAKMVLLYGAEWTSALGHANIFGTKPYDYAPIWAARDGDGATSVATAHAQGLHFSVNHPAAKDLWELGFDLAFDSMEVWTAPFVFPNSNINAIAKWDELLRGGRRLSVRGGSDSHHQHDLESTLFNIGNPTTWIYSRARTGDAILEGLKAGRVTLSYAATAERIDFTADVDGDGVFETIVGDNVRPAVGQSIHFKVDIAGFRATSTYNVTVFKNGTSFKTWQLTTASVTFEDAPAAGERAYYRVEVRGPTSDAPIISAIAFGDFIALSNPIYVSFP
jgi:hypothetical protein